jgi:uncharacterized protein YkwD
MPPLSRPRQIEVPPRRGALVQIRTDSERKPPQRGWFAIRKAESVGVVRSSFLALVAFLVLAAPALAGVTVTRNESSLLHEMNRVRAQYGLGRLTYDPHLERAARAHSREMLRRNVFAHGAFGTRMLLFNVTGSLAGENLAWGTGARGSASGIVAEWLASPEHRANLLRPSFARVGVGALVGPFRGFAGARVVTVDFAG